MKNNDLSTLKKELKFLKFALSNTVDPINVIHLEGQIKVIVDKIKKIKDGEHTEQVTMEKNELKGGLGDNKTLLDLAKKYAYDDSTDSVSKENIQQMLKKLKNQLSKGINIEKEHTNDLEIAKEIAMDHLSEDPNYYDKLEKVEAKEQTTAGSSGAFEPSLSAPILKRDIHKIHNFKKGEFKEATDSSSSGQYDVAAFAGKGRSKNPLKIDGVKSIANSRAVKDKNFPKWGGPDSVFVKVKDKCKKFPYCTQGDINAIEPLREAIQETAKKYGLPIQEVEKIVLIS